MFVRHIATNKYFNFEEEVHQAIEEGIELTGKQPDVCQYATAHVSDVLEEYSVMYSVLLVWYEDDYEKAVRDMPPA